MFQKKILTISLSSLLFILIGFGLAYLIFDVKLINFKKEIIQAIQSNNIIGLPTNESQTDLGSFEKKITDNIQIAKESVVHIMGSYISGQSDSRSGDFVGGQIVNGNGIVISEDGFIITDKLIVQQANLEYKIIDFWGNIYKLDKVLTDNNSRLAIIKLKSLNGTTPKDMVPAKIISSKSSPQVGQRIFSIGRTSTDNINTVMMGIISAKNKKVPTTIDIIGSYQIDIIVFPDGDGSAVIDTNGEIIGIQTSYKNINYVLPVSKEFITWIFSSIQRNGKILYPSFGFDFVEINANNKSYFKINNNNGAIVTQIYQGSEASKKGIQVGDLIMGINGKEINNNDPFLSQLYGYKIGEKIVLNIQRGGENIDIDVFLGEISQ